MRNRWVIILGSVGALLLICACAFAWFTPQIALWAGGFRSQGDTETFLEELSEQDGQAPIAWDSNVSIDSNSGTADSGGSSGSESAGGNTAAASQQQSGSQLADTRSETVAVSSSQPLQTVVVELDGQRGQIDTQAAHASRAEQAQVSEGAIAYYFEYSEQDLNRLISDAVATNMPPDLQGRVRNVGVDLRSNAVVVSAEANLEVGWQAVSAIVAFNNTGTQFQIAGIDVNGQLYSTPPDGFLGEWLRLAETEGNRALQTAAFVAPDGSRLTVQQVYIGEEVLQVVAQ